MKQSCEAPKSTLALLLRVHSGNIGNIRLAKGKVLPLCQEAHCLITIDALRRSGAKSQSSHR
jgi:hypothetical protein